MKKARLFLVFLLVSALLLITTNSAFASSIQNESSPFSDTYNDLPDDAIVCYMLGRPVYKYEIDEYGFIHKTAIATRNHSSYYVESRLPSSYRNKPVTAHGGMATQGFSQNDTFMYMDVQTGISVAQHFEAGNNAAGIIAFFGGAAMSLVGVSAPLSIAISAVLSLPAMARAEIASQIRAFTDNNEKCLMLEMRNSYGTFRAIHSWDGEYAIRYPQSLNPPSTAWVDGVVGYNGSTIWGASS